MKESQWVFCCQRDPNALLGSVLVTISYTEILVQKNEVTKDHVRQESSVSDFVPYRIVEMIKDDTDFRFARLIVLSLTRCTNRLRQPGPDPLWNITLTPGGEGAQRIYTVRRVARGHLSGAPKIEFS